MRSKGQRLQNTNRPKSFLGLGLSFAVVLLHLGKACSQEPLAVPTECWKAPALDCQAMSALFSSDPLDVASTSGTPRLRLNRMLPGFLSDPPSLTGFDDFADPETAALDNGPNWMTANFGDDNPYLDPRRPGDPGGVGFLHVHSQVQLVDTGSTCVCLAFRAWMPAGLENGGVQKGQTQLAPGLGFFQDLGSGNALQAFFDQTMRNPARQGPARCGMAWNCPLPLWDDSADRGMFLFVQALGQYDYGYDRQGRPMNWELVPGVQWQLTDVFGMSLGASKYNMLTCWWHF